MNRLFRLTLFLALAYLVSAAPLHAATLNWSYAGTNRWFNNAANWSGGVLGTSDILMVDTLTNFPLIDATHTNDASQLLIGTTAPGEVDMSDGTQNIASVFRVGNVAGDSYFKMTGGTFNKAAGASIRFGWHDSGTAASIGHLVMSNGATLNNPNSNFLFGYGLNTKGYLDMTDSTITSAGVNTVFGWDGNSQVDLKGASNFTQTGGNLILAENSTSTTNMTISGTSQLNNTGTNYIEIGQGGTANVTLNDTATISSSGLIIVAYRGATGTLTLNPGTSMFASGGLQVANAEFQSTTTGTLNMNGATLNVKGLDTGFRAKAVAVLNINNSTISNSAATFIGHYGGPGSSSTLNMTGSSKFLNSGDFQIANSENSDFGTVATVNLHDTASITESGYFIMAAWAGSQATLNMDGSSTLVQQLNSASTPAGQFHMGWGGGNATINLNGNASITNVGTYMGNASQIKSTATLNLNGGVFATNFLNGGGGSAQTVNFNGSTLEAQADAGNFMSGDTTLFHAWVKGGSTINTTDTSSTAHSVWASIPLQHDPSVTTDGGLTIKGAGTLVLAAQNTYNGPTTVSGGVLSLTPAAALASTSVTVASAAELDVGSVSNFGTLSHLDLQSGSTIGFAIGAGDNALKTTTTGMINKNGLTFAVTPLGRTLAAGTYTVIQGFNTPGSATPAVAPTLNVRGMTLDSAAIDGTHATVKITGTQASVNLLWSPTDEFNIVWNVNTSNFWSNGGNQDVFYNLDSVKFDETLGNPVAQVLNVVGLVHPADITIDNTMNPYVFNGSGAITGVGTTLTKTGTNTVTFNVPLNITGDISLQGGTISFGSASGNTTLPGQVSISNKSVIDIQSGVFVNLTGNVADPDNSGLHVSGSGVATLALPAITSLHGPTQLDGGIVKVPVLANGGSPSSIGDSSSDPTNLVFNGGTLQYVGGSNVTTDRGFDIKANWSMIDTAKDITFSGLVTGEGGALMKNGLGAVSLTNVNNAPTWYQLEVWNGSVNLSGDSTHTPVYSIGPGSGNYGSLVVGYYAGTAAVNLSNVSIVMGDGNLYLGYTPGSSGYMAIKNGVSLTSLAGYFTYIGANSGRGVLDQTGGYFQSGEYTSLGEGSFGFGVYNMTGGTADINNLSAPWSFNVGVSGDSTGVLNVSGTAHMTAAPGAPIYVGVYDNSIGIVNLGAVGSSTDTSILTAPGLGRYGQSGLTTGYLNFHGGTLQANADNAHFLSTAGVNGGFYGLTAVTVYAEGAKIDTNGHAITIDQNLSAPTGSGVTNIAVSGGSGYIGAPTVEISGGHGVGATAYAVMSGGTVDHIVISNPGTGYLSTDVLTVKLVGQVGAGGTPATVGAVALAPNLVTGGLTKLGDGKLTLSTTNTYGGVTTISGGTLALDTNGQISSSSSIVNNATFSILDGTHAVHAISGTGTTAVYGASVLTAPSIVQGSLIIGGVAPAAALGGGVGSGIVPAPGSLVRTSGVNTVPEPGTLVMLVLAGLALAGTCLRRK